MRSKNYILISRNFILLPIFCILMSFGIREPNYCKIARRIAGTYAIEFAQPRGLQLTGYGGAMMGDIQEIELRFLSLEYLNIAAARKLYVEMMEEFLCRINTCEKIRSHLHNFPFEVANINLTIGFEDCERKITSDGHVALMYIGRNQDLLFRGYSSDTEEFYSLHRESYHEARKIVTACQIPNHSD